MLCFFVSWTDIDECALGTDNCDATATCTDTEGSFNCTCNPGFEGDGVNCMNAATIGLSSAET